MRSQAARWLVSMAVLLALQTQGCWCQPTRPERFNPFPEPLSGTSADYCAALADARCSHAQRCEPAVFAGLGAEGGCADAMRLRCEAELAVVRAAEENGGMLYNARAARGCVESTRQRACDEELSASCAEVFTGNLGPDAPCANDMECTAGLFCSGGPDSCGLCVPKFDADGPCWGPSSCQGGLLCVAGRCTWPLALGTLCFGRAGLCPPGAVCAGIFPPLASCNLPVPRGSACDLLPCAQGLSCVASDAGSRCLPAAALQEPCDPQGRTAPLCAGAGVRTFCDTSQSSCQVISVAAEGEGCGQAAICASSHTCVSGICQPRPRAGEVCTLQPGREPCFESICTDGICQAPSRLGDSCDGGCQGGMACVSGRCGLGPCDGGAAWDAFVPGPDGSVP